MKFRIGQKVCCISEPLGPVMHPWAAYPKFGEVYIIRGYRPDEYPSVLLYEIKSTLGYDGFEPGFWEDRFRPVVTRETDISCFKALLKPKSEPVA